jgi:curved DNA-binding protein CbpA
MMMAEADHGEPGLDLYQLLGVSRDASREEIALAWRRRARHEHPDSRPADADAPGRFRALAGAWRVLGDPTRRAAYDRALDRGRPPAVRVRVAVRRPEPPLRAGPVRVEGVRAARPAGGWDEEDFRLAVLSELALQYLARDRSRPW